MTIIIDDATHGGSDPGSWQRAINRGCLATAISGVPLTRRHVPHTPGKLADPEARERLPGSLDARLLDEVGVDNLHYQRSTTDAR